MDYPFKMQVLAQMKVWLACLVLVAIVIGFCTFAKSAGKSAAEDIAASCDTSETGAASNSTDCQCVQAGYYNVIHDDYLYSLCTDWLEKKATAAATNLASVFAIMIVNVAAKYIAFYLAQAQKPTSVTGLYRSAFIIAFLLQEINLGVVTVLVNAQFESALGIGLFGKGVYSRLEPGWYNTVGGAILMVLIMNAGQCVSEALKVPWQNCWRKRAMKRQQSKEALLEISELSRFPFALRHAEQLCGLFTMIVFSSAMPLLNLLLPLYLCLFYWTDKYTLLRGSTIPPCFDSRIMKSMIRLLQLALFMHAMMAVWVYSEYDSVPSFCSGEDCEGVSRRNFTNVLLKSKIVGTGGNFITDQLGKRLKYSAAVPGFLVALFIATFWLLRVLLFLFGGTALNFLVMLHGKKRREKGSVPTTRGKSNHKPVSAAAKEQFSTDQDPNAVLRSPVRGKPLSEMKRLQMPSTYNLSTVPGYEFLAGCEAFTKASKELPVNEVHSSHSDKGAIDKELHSGQKGGSRWPASSSNEQEALIEDPLSVTGVLIDAGVELTCGMNGFVFEQGLVHLGEDAVIGLVQEGMSLVAAGPPELESGFVMVPIEPCGCVDVSLFVPNQGGAARLEQDARMDPSEEQRVPQHSEHASLLDDHKWQYGPEPAVLGIMADQTSNSSAGSHGKAHTRSAAKPGKSATQRPDEHAKKSVAASKSAGPKVAAKKVDKSRSRTQSPHHTQ